MHNTLLVTIYLWHLFLIIDSCSARGLRVCLKRKSRGTWLPTQPMFRRQRHSSGASSGPPSPEAARKAVLALLGPLLPAADPAYLEGLLAFYDLSEPPDRIAQRVARKVFEVNAGEFPRAADGDARSPDSRNAYLEALAELFPDADLAFLRQCIIAEKSDVVNAVAAKLLRLDAESGAGYPRRLRVGEPLTDADRFRTPQYVKGCLTRLCNEFPDRWKSTIRAVLAECNDDFLSSHARLAAMPRSTWVPNFISKMFHRKAVEDPAIYNVELLRDVDRLAARRAEEAVKEDAELARKLNTDEYVKTGDAITCGCCFDDFAFEDLEACPLGHVFCRACIARYVSEAVFGQQGNAVEDDGFRCMDASEGSRCSKLLSDAVVEKSAGADVFAKWTEKRTEAELKKAGVPYLKCLFCAYAEIDSEGEDKARRGYDSAAVEETAGDLLRGLLYGTLTAVLMAPFFGTFIVTSVFLASFFPALVARPLLRILPYDEFSDHPLPRFLRFMLPDPPAPKLPPARLFRCLNPKCSRRSCLTCRREWIGLHKCHGDLASSLRQYVEHAMTLALVRTCPRCNLQFQKADGCNKMTCPGCGYVLCYVCRKEIGSEGYGHFWCVFCDASCALVGLLTETPFSANISVRSWDRVPNATAAICTR